MIYFLVWSDRARADGFGELSWPKKARSKLVLWSRWPILTMVDDHGCWPKNGQNQKKNEKNIKFEFIFIWRIRGALMSPKSSVQTLVMTKLQIVPFSYHSETGSYGFKHTTHWKNDLNCLPCSPLSPTSINTLFFHFSRPVRSRYKFKSNLIDEISDDADQQSQGSGRNQSATPTGSHNNSFGAGDNNLTNNGNDQF